MLVNRILIFAPVKLSELRSTVSRKVNVPFFLRVFNEAFKQFLISSLAKAFAVLLYI